LGRAIIFSLTYQERWRQGFVWLSLQAASLFSLSQPCVAGGAEERPPQALWSRLEYLVGPNYDSVHSAKWQ
jgi:hypothetical protein